MNAKEFFEAVAEMREAQNMHAVEDTAESFNRKKMPKVMVWMQFIITIATCSLECLPRQWKENDI